MLSHGRECSMVVSAFLSLSWILLWAVVFMELEKDTGSAIPWTYENSIYFCVISVCTIGLGDIIVTRWISIMLFWVYLIIGVPLIAFFVFCCATVIHSGTGLADRPEDREQDLHGLFA